MHLKEKALLHLLNSALESDNIDLTDNLNTGEILKNFDFEEEVIAAGYLHNLTPSGDLDINTISNLFGGAVSSLILTSINLERFMNKEKAHKEKLKQYKELPYKNKAVIVSSLINEIRTRNIIDFEKEKVKYDELFESLDHNVTNIKLENILTELYNTITNKYYNPIEPTFKKDLTQTEILKKIMNESNEFIVEFNNNEKKTDFNTLFHNFNSNDTFILCVNDSINYNSKGLTREERDALLYAELELRFLTQMTEGQRIIIISNTLANKLTLLNKLLDQNKITEKELFQYFDYLTQTVNYISVILDNYKKSLTIEDVTNYMELLIKENINPNTNYYKIFEVLLPKMKKEYVKELKLHLENK